MGAAVEALASPFVVRRNEGAIFRKELRRIQAVLSAQDIRVAGVVVFDSAFSDLIPGVGQQVILLVEDEVLIRMSVAEELRDHGATVVEAADADEAIAVLRSSARIDLLFTDIQMPGAVDGVGLAQLARTMRPGLKIVMTSGRVSLSLQRELADAFVPKPYDIAHVARQFEALLDRAPN